MSLLMRVLTLSAALAVLMNTGALDYVARRVSRLFGVDAFAQPADRRLNVSQFKSAAEYYEHASPPVVLTHELAARYRSREGGATPPRQPRYHGGADEEAAEREGLIMQSDEPRRRAKRDYDGRCAFGTPLHTAFFTCFVDYMTDVQFVQQLLDPRHSTMTETPRSMASQHFRALIEQFKTEDLTKDPEKGCWNFFLYFSCLRTKLLCLERTLTPEQVQEFRVEFALAFSRCNELGADATITKCAQPLYRNMTCSSSRADMGIPQCRSQYFKCRDKELLRVCPGAEWQARMTMCQLDAYLLGACLFNRECLFITQG